jgi:peptide/nickel transport system ATP-binding protein/oligopeptide transport system ATP-binding protein
MDEQAAEKPGTAGSICAGSKNLLEVSNLRTYFHTDEGIIRAVDGVDFTIGRGEALGIVGESGCGKSVTALSIMRLITSPPGQILANRICFDGKNLLDLPSARMRHIRGNDISMIFQEPMISLDPIFSVGDQLAEVITLHQKMGRKEAREKVIDALSLVGIPSPESRIDEYPHQMSGGMGQRVMIAMALSCNPKLLIADEPTTALDVTIQAQILELMKGLIQKLDTAIMMITHDLGVVYEFCERVLVMYLGKVVEQADTKTIFSNPKHPYTIGLIESTPRLDISSKRLQVIEGNVPNPADQPLGCSFNHRCRYRQDICSEKEPEMAMVDDNHMVRCWLHADKKNKTLVNG